MLMYSVWSRYAAAHPLVFPSAVQAEVRHMHDVDATLGARKMVLSSVPTHVYYLADGSPSSGFEVLAVVESTSRPGVVSYRRLPFTFMQFGMQSLNHKVYQFLWLMFLECGPSYHVIRHELYMTRAFLVTVALSNISST